MQAQKLEFGDEVKVIFLLCSLLALWDTFRIAISNFAPDGTLDGTLTFNDVVGSLLAEEIRRKSMDQGKKSISNARGKRQKIVP